MEESPDTFRQRLKGKIVFISRPGKDDYEICVMQANGTDYTRLTSFPMNDMICFVGWSPDGKHIAFTSHRSGNYEIYVMSANGSKQKRLTFMRTTTYGAAWSPDGKHIAFTSTASGTEEVYVMNANGSTIRRITATSCIEDSIPKAYNKNPTWSPDGQRIAFASARSGNQEIYIMNADGSEPKQLTDSLGMKDFPSWSPDGKYVAFVAGGIFVVDISGANLRQLTNTPLFDTHPTWSPDAKYIAFGSRVGIDLKARPPYLGHTEIFVVDTATTQSIQWTATNTNCDCPAWIP